MNLISGYSMRCIFIQKRFFKKLADRCHICSVIEAAPGGHVIHLVRGINSSESQLLFITTLIIHSQSRIISTLLIITLAEQNKVPVPWQFLRTVRCTQLLSTEGCDSEWPLSFLPAARSHHALFSHVAFVLLDPSTYSIIRSHPWRWFPHQNHCTTQNWTFVKL